MAQDQVQSQAYSQKPLTPSDRNNATSQIQPPYPEENQQDLVQQPYPEQYQQDPSALFAGMYDTASTTQSELSAQQTQELMAQRAAYEEYSRNYHGSLPTTPEPNPARRVFTPVPPGQMYAYPQPEQANQQHSLNPPTVSNPPTYSESPPSQNQYLQPQPGLQSPDHQYLQPQSGYQSPNYQYAQPQSGGQSPNHQHLQSQPGHHSPNPGDFTEANSSSMPQDGVQSEEQVLAQTLVFTQNLGPPPPQELLRPLAKQIAIPQVYHGAGSPFTRAYAPVLQSYGIDVEIFLSFLDGLNIANASAAPFRWMSYSGQAMGASPEPISAMVGAGLEVVGEAGSGIMTSMQNDKFLKASNNELFHPRKLHVGICSTAALKEVTGMPKEMKMAAPLEGTTPDMSVLDRRMAAVAPYLSPLTGDVPAQTKVEGKLTQLIDKEAAKQVVKNEEKMIKKREKQREKLAKGKQPSSEDDDETKAAKKAKWLFIQSWHENDWVDPLSQRSAWKKVVDAAA